MFFSLDAPGILSGFVDAEKRVQQPRVLNERGYRMLTRCDDRLDRDSLSDALNFRQRFAQCACSQDARDTES